MGGKMLSHDSMLRPDVRRRIASVMLLTVIVLLSVLTCVVPYGRDEELGPIVSEEDLSAINDGDTAWMLTSCTLVLLMTPALAFFYGGMVRSMNLISTLLQSFVIMGLIMTLWTFVGFSLAFGEDANGAGIIGNPATYLFLRNVGAKPNADLAPTIPLTVYCMFQATFAIITPALITGAVVERANFNAMMLFVTLWHLVVYCPIAHMEWAPGGLIREFGHHDYAGGTVVHMSSGWSALVLSALLGKRVGDKSTHHAPAHVPYVILGASLLWVGWAGFNGGSALSASYGAGQALLMTNIATGSAMLGWILWDYIQGRKVSAIGACAGAIVGLVGITPACGFVTAGGALIIGIVTAIICNTVMHYFKIYGKVDDTLDVFAGHGMGGTVGMIMTSLFSTTRVSNVDDLQGLFYGEATLFWHTIVVALLVICYYCLMTAFLFYVVNFFIKFRVSEEFELQGLDSSVHGETSGFSKPNQFSMDDSRKNGWAGTEMPLKATGGTAASGSPADSVQGHTHAAGAPHV
jgi:Amt family ammonium transporter